ncbi:MAG: cytochrome P450 [Deltaproteobacteria bacterium]|nr:cytochrome P450 [Deltaproteobacteria bacterium]
MNAPPDDLLAPDAVADPHAFFARLREHAPVHWSARHRAWLLTSHAEVSAALRDNSLSTARMDAFAARLAPARREALAPALDLLRGWMLFNDPPAHDRMRAPVARAFTPRRVEKLRGAIEQVVDELLAAFEARGGGDFVAELAHPLPAIVIADLFGVPKADRDMLVRWSAKFGVIVFGATERADYEQKAREAGLELRDYVAWLVAQRKAAGELGDDLLGALLATAGTQDGLREEELAGACSLLLFAGHDTTASLLGSSVNALLRDDAARAAFPRDADDPRAPAAIEELLRFEGPAKIMMRRALHAHERGGRRIEAGHTIFMALGAANRDPAVFAQPDRLDLARSPNPHVAFGDGIHFCLGAPLARLEARIALTRLFARFPKLALAREEVRWRATISDRSLVELHVAI